jgi:hypothetical protein
VAPDSAAAIAGEGEADRFEPKDAVRNPGKHAQVLALVVKRLPPRPKRIFYAVLRDQAVTLAARGV